MRKISTYPMLFTNCQNSVGKCFLDGGGKFSPPGQGRTLTSLVQIGLNEQNNKIVANSPENRRLKATTDALFREKLPFFGKKVPFFGKKVPFFKKKCPPFGKVPLFRKKSPFLAKKRTFQEKLPFSVKSVRLR